MAAENLDTGFLLTDKEGETLLSKNEHKPLIPASTLKILTSLVAISYLGEDFQYQTIFYYDEQSSDLYVKGFGDPMFISEEINKACKLLASKIKGKTINNIILDHSFFEEDIKIPGRSNTLNPYDAHQGALCANFNTVFFTTGKNNTLISAEEQTPLLPIFTNKIVASRLKKGRIKLSKNESKLYPGLLIKFFLENNGVVVSGTISSGTIPLKNNSKPDPLLTYYSDIALKDIVRNLLEYSNNFTANQLLLTLGARFSKPPSNLEKSVAVVNSFLLNNFPDDYKNLSIYYVEGSGISRRNTITCKSMIKILIKFMPYHKLMRQNDNGFYKTGTLSGIRTIAGYLEGKNESLYPYVIMINKKGKNYKEILKKMKKQIKQNQ